MREEERTDAAPFKRRRLALFLSWSPLVQVRLIVGIHGGGSTTLNQVFRLANFNDKRCFVCHFSSPVCVLRQGKNVGVLEFAMAWE